MFTCYAGENDNECLLAIGTGKADWGVVDAADIAFGYSNLGLQVVVAEEKGAGVGTNYFAVAVVKKEFCEAVESRNPYGASLADLRGVNSCHTGYRKNAGEEGNVRVAVMPCAFPFLLFFSQSMMLWLDLNSEFTHLSFYQHLMQPK